MVKVEMRVNGNRLKDSLLEMAKIGATERGGVHRLALTDEDKRARDLFIQWMKEAGLEVVVDEVGNVSGRRLGIEPKVPPLLVGSHLDSQPKGGKLDGSYGVIGALEAVRTLNDQGVRTYRPVEIVSWSSEEGSRFPPMSGSGVFTGAYTLDFVYHHRDKQGKTFGEELRRIGYKGSAPCKRRDLHAFLELHIEQGPVLESEKKTIGVVQGIIGIAWLNAEVHGESNQAGPTPMHKRKDALVAAADIIRAIRNIPLRVGGDLVSTVGSLDVIPNSRNTIPGQVRFTVDFRSIHGWRVDSALEMLNMEVNCAARREGVKAEIKQVWRIPYTAFSRKCIDTIEHATRRLGYDYMPIVSGAGHDAKHLADICDTGMIFVPSIGGRSHAEEEATDWEHLEAGCNVLLHSALALAER